MLIYYILSRAVHGHSHGDITVLHDDSCVPKVVTIEVRDPESQSEEIVPTEKSEPQGSNRNEDTINSTEVATPGDDEHAHAPGRQRNHLQLFVFAAALAVHSILDGFAIGSEQSIDGFYSMIIAVLSHKGFDGIVLGVPLFLGGVTLTISMIVLALSAVMTPIGIGIAMAVTESAFSVLPQAIVMSISAGSFLYIALVEMLPSALRDRRWVLLKLIAFFIGWFALVIIAGYGHNHAHGIHGHDDDHDHHDDDHDHDDDHHHDDD